MSKKDVIKVRVGSSVVFFAVRLILFGESVSDARARMENPLVKFASATHLDVLLGYYRRNQASIHRGWRKIFGVGAQCRIPYPEPYSNLYTVWGLDVRSQEIHPYDENRLPTGKCGILVAVDLLQG